MEITRRRRVLLFNNTHPAHAVGGCRCRTGERAGILSKDVPALTAERNSLDEFLFQAPEMRHLADSCRLGTPFREFGSYRGGEIMNETLEIPNQAFCRNQTGVNYVDYHNLAQQKIYFSSWCTLLKPYRHNFHKTIFSQIFFFI